MSALSRFSVDNPVTVNLLMLSILVMGVALYHTRVPKEIFPEFSENQIVITTVYPGASAFEIEKNVTLKIEDAVHDLDSVEELFSTSQEGLSTVTLKIAADEKNFAKLISDAQQAVDQIEDFPEDAEDPIITEVESNIPVITVSLYGDVNLKQLKFIVEDLEDAIQAVPGVADVRLSGLPEREIWVEVSPEALERHGLALADISRAIRERNYDLPGGALTTPQGEFLVRTVGKAPDSRGLEAIPILTTATGGVVRLGEVATVRDWFERETTIGRFNLRRAVNLNVTKTREGDSIQVADAVEAVVDSFRDRLPPTVDVGVFNDTSIYVENRLKTLTQSGAQGLVVVFLFLLLMLNTRVALLVTLGIPISFLGAVVIMAYVGMTMNMMAMFALIIVLGLVVDDAVVIGENVYRHYENGMSPREAAIKGASEVAWPVISAVATTIAAFSPLLLIPGAIGVFLGVIPQVVIFALLVSLLEALVILPSHMADFLPRTPPRPGRMRQRLDAAIQNVTRRYGVVLQRVLDQRYVFMAAATAFTVALIAYAALHLPFRLFQDFESSQFYVNVEAPTSYALEDTEALVKQVERAVQGAIPQEELVSLVTNVGFLMNDFNSVDQGAHLAQMIVELKELGQGRDRFLREVTADVREAVAPLRGESAIRVQELQAGPGGKPIYVLVRGENLDELRAVADEIKRFIGEFPGAADLKDNLEAGKPELQVRLKPQAYALGLTDAAVGLQLRDAFRGAESSKFQTAREDIDVRVKLPEERTKTVDALTRFMVTLPSGAKAPLTELADVVKVQGVASIIHDDRTRAVIITGELDQSQTTATELAAAVQARFGALGERLPGYVVETERGEVQDINESFSGLSSAFLLGLLLIYFILGAQFKSYVQPLVVMGAIPFGVVGVLLGLIITGEPLGLMSMIGLVALSGIVVNDSLVLVDFTNQRRREGAARRASLVEAGMLRLRPVVLTSVTTMGGLFFLAFLASGQAKFLSPMAIAIFFGLMASTVITLFIAPCLYAVLDDATAFVRRPRPPRGRKTAEPWRQSA